MEKTSFQTQNPIEKERETMEYILMRNAGSLGNAVLNLSEINKANETYKLNSKQR